MKQGAEWYKREPVAYLGGVQGLTAKEHAVYSVVLDLIYVHGGSINNDPKWIAGWISDMGSAAVRKALENLIERGKLFADETQIRQKRAENQAKTKEKLRETARKSGKKGGEKSAEIRRQHIENKDLDEPPATSEIQPEKRREEKSIDADDAGAREDRTFRERLLGAMSVDPVSGLTGPSGGVIGTSLDMIEAEKWMADLGLSEDECISVVREVMAKRGNDPPSRFRYFTAAMADLAAAKSQPTLTPSPPKERQHGPSKQAAKQSAFIAGAREAS